MPTLKFWNPATSEYVSLIGGAAGGGGAPSGAAGGDLAGTYPDPTVVDDSHNHTSTTISALDAGDTTTGTFDIARIPTGTTSTTVSLENHNHSGVYDPAGTAASAITTHEAAADPHTGYQKESEKGSASGYASLDTGTKVPIAQIPTGTTGTTVSLGDHNHNSSYFQLATIDAKGDLLVGSADNTVSRLAVGTNGFILTADSSQATGTKWAEAFGRSVSVISGNTAAGSTAKTDYIYICSATLTLTLPTAVGNTNLYTVKRTGAGNVTIATTSSQTIDGASNHIITVQYISVDLISDGANWVVV